MVLFLRKIKAVESVKPDKLIAGGEQNWLPDGVCRRVGERCHCFDQYDPRPECFEISAGEDC
jgi:hypothetical protein